MWWNISSFARWEKIDNFIFSSFKCKSFDVDELSVFFSWNLGSWLLEFLTRNSPIQSQIISNGFILFTMPVWVIIWIQVTFLTHIWFIATIITLFPENMMHNKVHSTPKGMKNKVIATHDYYCTKLDVVGLVISS